MIFHDYCLDLAGLHMIFYYSLHITGFIGLGHHNAKQPASYCNHHSFEVKLTLKLLGPTAGLSGSMTVTVA